MAKKLLNQKTIKKYFTEILNNQLFIDELTYYQLSQVLLYAEKIIDDEIARDHDIFSSTKVLDPDSYTEEYYNAGLVYTYIDDYFKKQESQKIKDGGTIVDNLFQELNVIEDIFKAQTIKYPGSENDQPWKIFSPQNEPIDGCFFDLIDIFSNLELFKYQDYIKYFSDRSESKLLQNELKEILLYANEIVNVYKCNFVDNKDLLSNKNKSIDNGNIYCVKEKKYAIAWINDYSITKIKIAKKRISGTYEVLTRPKFQYTWKNSGLIEMVNYLIDFIGKFELNNKNVKTTKIEEINQNLNLIDKLDKASYWPALKKMLADNNYVDLSTGISIDEGKGNYGFFASMLKNLHQKKYYCKNKKPSVKEIQVILENTFGVYASFDTCNKAKSNDFNFDFIQYASEIE